jgi:hypothetical protein
MKRILTLLLILFPFTQAPGREYHVTTSGSDAADGSLLSPFRTISRAAQLALPGDTVTVHGGTYREWVDPLYGGTDDANRILYRAAEGEVVELKGSEPVTDWKKGKDGVWTAVLPNSFFGAYNPFADRIHGDWFVDLGRVHHTAEVYLDDVSLYEVERREIVARTGATVEWEDGPKRITEYVVFRKGDKVIHTVNNYNMIWYYKDNSGILCQNYEQLGIVNGEIGIVEEGGKLIWECPNCGNRDQRTLNVCRRTCGYLGTQFWNQGRTAEIKDRVMHL